MPAKTDELAAQLDDLQEQIGLLTKANADLTVQLKAAAKGDPVPQPSDAEVKLAKQLADATEALKAAEDARKAAEDKLAKHEPAPKEERIDLASLPAAVRRQLEKAEEQEKRIAETEAQLAKMAESAAIEKAVATVAKKWPTLPGKAEHFGLVYRKIAGALDEDELKEVHRIFDSHAKFADIAASALGRSHVQETGDAMAEIRAKAEALRKVDPRLNEAAAIAKIAQDYPELYAKYRDEQYQN